MTYSSHIQCLFAINCYFVDTLDKNKNVCLNTFLDPIHVVMFCLIVVKIVTKSVLLHVWLNKLNHRFRAKL